MILLIIIILVSTVMTDIYEKYHMSSYRKQAADEIYKLISYDDEITKCLSIGPVRYLPFLLLLKYYIFSYILWNSFPTILVIFYLIHFNLLSLMFPVFLYSFDLILVSHPLLFFQYDSFET